MSWNRSFSARRNAEKAERAARRRRWKIAIGVAAIVFAALAYYVWATTLCGGCAAPAI